MSLDALADLSSLNDPIGPSSRGEECDTATRKRGRKRSNPDSYSKVIAEIRHNAGESYVSRSGKHVAEHKFAYFDCNCPLKCGSKCIIEVKERMHEFY